MAEEKKSDWTCILLLAVFASAIGGSFQFGYHIGCINVPSRIIKNWYIESHKVLFNETKTYDEIGRFQWALTVGIFAVGGAVGGLGSGKTADWLGRKGAMFLNDAIALVAAVLMTCARYVEMYPLLIVGRFIIGINAGMASGLVPMYLTEISPLRLRGALGSVAQLLVTIGILFSQVIGLPQLLGTEKLWPLIFGFTVVPMLIQVIFLPMCPESPKYTLIVKNKHERAEHDLKKLRGTDDVEEEIKAMKDEQRRMMAVEKLGLVDMFRGEHAWPMFIAIMMMCAQQFSGINVAMFYSTMIFEGAGLGANAVYATLIMGLINVLMTVVSMYLVDHPKCGRLMLLLIGLSGMLVASVAIVVFISVYSMNKTVNQWASYPAAVFVFLFVIFFATGPGSIPWFFVSELFSSGARGAANSIAAMVNWAANFIVGTSFEFLNQVSKQFTFLIFSCFLAFFIFFTWMYVPETKNRTVEDVQEELKRGKTRFARNKQVNAQAVQSFTGTDVSSTEGPSKNPPLVPK